MNIPGKPIEIKTNERDQRSTANFLAYPMRRQFEDLAKEQWITGGEAERIYYRNRTHCVKNPMKLLWTPNNTEFANLPPVATVAIALFQNVRDLKPKVDKVNLIIPFYTSPQVRYLLHQSMKLLGFRATTLVDSCTAVASLYAVEKIKKGRKPTTVMFVDIGAENIDISLWRFRPANKRIVMELLEYRHRSDVGGSFVDERLLAYAEEQIGRKITGSEVFTALALLKKGKERLATGTEIGVDMTEDFDKYLTLTQELMANLTSDMTKKISQLLEGMSKPDEIELIGGSSRLKVFIDAVSEVFPDVTPRRSLNSDEAAALGGTYYAALKAGTVTGSQLDVRKPAIFGFSLTSQDGVTDLYEKGELVEEMKVKWPLEKSRILVTTLNLTVPDEYVIDSEEFKNISPNYTQILIEGVERAVEGVEEEMVPGTQPYIKMMFGLSPELDCPDLIEATLVANITTTNKRLITVKHGNTTKTERKLFVVSTLSDPEFVAPPDARKFVMRMTKADNDRRIRQEACHKIEAFIIDTREKAEFDPEFATVTTPEERKEIIERLEKERSEIDCTTLVNETAEDLEKRLDALEKQFEKPLQRLDEMLHRPVQLNKLKSVLEKAEATIPEAKCDNETLDKFKEYVNETKNLIAKVTNIGPLDQPEFLVKDMKDRETELLKKIPEVKRASKKSELINFSSSDADDMDDEEWERLRAAGIMMNRPKRRKKRPQWAPKKDILDDLETTRKEYRARRDAHDKERREWSNNKYAWQRENRDYYRFESKAKQTPEFEEYMANVTVAFEEEILQAKIEDERNIIERITNRTIKMVERYKNETRINQTIKIMEERGLVNVNTSKWNGAFDVDVIDIVDDGTCMKVTVPFRNETCVNLTTPGNEGKCVNITIPDLVVTCQNITKTIRFDNETLATAQRVRRRRIEEAEAEAKRLEKKRKKEEKKRLKQEAKELEERMKAEEERLKREEEERRLAAMTPEERQRLADEEERKRKAEEDKKRRLEEERQKFLEMHMDDIDDDFKPLTPEEIKKFDEGRRKFEGRGSRPFKNEAERRQYEEERRNYEALKRRYRPTPTPKPTPTPTPEPTPVPKEEVEAEVDRLERDRRRYYEDRMRFLRDRAQFEKVKELYPPWKEEQDAIKAKQEAEREERRRKLEEDRERMRIRREKEAEERRIRQEAERQRRQAELERREAERRRMEERRREMEEQRRKAAEERRQRLEEDRRRHEQQRQNREQQHREAAEKNRDFEGEERELLHEIVRAEAEIETIENEIDSLSTQKDNTGNVQEEEVGEEL